MTGSFTFYPFWILLPLLFITCPAGADRWNYLGMEDAASPTGEMMAAINDPDVITISGYELRKDGSLNKVGVPTLHQSIRKDIRKYPLVAFPDKATGTTILRNSDNRERALQSILRLSESFDGVHLDFEYLGPEDTIFLEKLLRRLHPAMKEKNRTLSLAIFPENFPLLNARFHDLSRIGTLADEFVLMTYDYHRPSTEPGPVTDVSWAEQAITLALRHVQPSELWLGVPTYGYAWQIGTRRYRTLHKYSFRTFLSCKGGTVNRHSSQMLIGRCPARSDGGSKAEIAYFPDDHLINSMKALAERYKLKGTAHWKLYSEK